ncbi:MAG: OadG family protein [Clostridia bacterium]|nr:OadG family protein [Clostridia bacterium]
MSFIGKLGYSLIVAIIGLFIVFLGLVILIGCIKAMSIIVGKMRENAEAKKPAPTPAPVVVPEPVAEAAAEEAGVDEGELVAVITAALMAYAKGNGGKTLVVKNIRRANAWANAGRADQLTRF